MNNKLGVVMTDRRVVIGLNGSIMTEGFCRVLRQTRTGIMARWGHLHCIWENDCLYESYPVRQGIVCNCEEASFLLKDSIKYATRWFQRINLKVRFSVRGSLTESELRALRDCYPNKSGQTFYMQEIMASILGMEEGIVIYVAYDFVEIAHLKDGQIKHLFVKECALEELRNSITEYMDKHKPLRIGERTMQCIINNFFQGKDYEVYGPNKITQAPEQLNFYQKDYLLMSSSWLNSLKDDIEHFVKKYDVKGGIYLMSDSDNVDYLAHVLSLRCNVKIHPINSALEKIAINLSIR